MAETGIEKEFLREYPYINQTKDCPVFQNYLQPLVEDGEVFACIREKKMDFYYRGRRMVRRSRDVYTINQFYLDGKQREGSPETSFRGNSNVDFNQILNFCEEKTASEKETRQIAKLYKNYSYLSKYADPNKPLLIDIEARFADLRPGATFRENDKIDLLFYLPNYEALLFVEVKRKKDSRVRSKVGVPEVVGQVYWYQEQIRLRGEDQILPQYRNVAKIMGDIFGKTFPEPRKVIGHVPILVVDDPRENTVGQKPVRHVNDTWLEPKLAELNGKQLWQKDDLLLIDGRKMFSGSHAPADDLGKLLEQSALYTFK